MSFRLAESGASMSQDEDSGTITVVALNAFGRRLLRMYVFLWSGLPAILTVAVGVSFAFKGKAAVDVPLLLVGVAVTATGWWRTGSCRRDIKAATVFRYRGPWREYYTPSRAANTAAVRMELPIDDERPGREGEKIALRIVSDSLLRQTISGQRPEDWCNAIGHVDFTRERHTVTEIGYRHV